MLRSILFLALFFNSTVFAFSKEAPETRVKTISISYEYAIVRLPAPKSRTTPVRGAAPSGLGSSTPVSP